MGFALLLARMLGAGPRVWKLITVFAVVFLAGLWLLPEGNPYAVDMGKSLRELGWIAAFAVPVTLYVLVIRTLRRRTGLGDAGLRGDGERKQAPRGLVQILEDGVLRADTARELAAEAPADALSRSFAWRSTDGRISGHLALGMLGRAADLHMLHVKPEFRGRGTGTELLAAGENQAREWGAKQMTATVCSWQNRDFLTNRGYSVMAEQDMGEGISRYWMRKDLA